MLGANIRTGRCRSKEAEWRLFSYLFTVRSIISSQNSCFFIHLRPFDPAELPSSLCKDLLAELEWQAQKAKETEALYI
jgi:hypothetical protein